MTREIVQHPLVMEGRWRLDGTTIPIADIRRDGIRMGRENAKRAYGFLELTDEEFDAIIAFDFPAVRELVLHLTSAAVRMECVCGETTPAASQNGMVDVLCICGRTWRVRITAQLLIGDDLIPITA